MRPHRLSPFFRFSFIIHSEGYLKGKVVYQSAHGVIFSFGELDEGRKAQVKSETWTLFYEKRKEVGNETVEVGEESEEVTHEEARGIGFYYAHYLWNDAFERKSDLR